MLCIFIAHVITLFLSLPPPPITSLYKVTTLSDHTMWNCSPQTTLCLLTLLYSLPAPASYICLFSAPNPVLAHSRYLINIYWFTGCGQWFGWMIRDLEGSWWQEYVGKRCVDSLLSGAKNVKIFMSHVNAHQRVTSAEEMLIIKWTGWPIIWIPVNLFPQPPLLSLSGDVHRLINKKWP